MSTLEPDPSQVTVEHFHESTGVDPRNQGYTLTRFYRRNEHTFRVTIKRDGYEQQSSAVAEVLNTLHTWTHIVSNAPSNWYVNTSLSGARPTQVNPEPGFTTLGRLADELARDAMTIVPA